MPKIDHQRWSNPFTQSGLRLPAAAGQEGCQLHEAGCMRLDADWRHEGVCSPFWRVFYDFNVGAWVRSGGRRFELGPGKVVVMPEGVPFDCGSRQGVEHLWLHFSMYLMLPPAAPGVFALPAGAALRAVAGELRDHIAAGELAAVRHTGTAMLHLIFAGSPGVRAETVPDRLRRVFNSIEHSLDGDITNPTLARQAGMSVEAFIRWFKARTGRTPAAFVAERRIREACRLLAFAEDSVEQVAEAVGFANRHHFSRVFKRHAGCGPAAFRRGRTRI
ncbi:MAG: helix-turn-helix transcriptional regulator [Opitutaceae bacterium]|nr:helix-turn-helix transcriptional regulator [Opitutaceae bacterium]